MIIKRINVAVDIIDDTGKIQRIGCAVKPIENELLTEAFSKTFYPILVNLHQKDVELGLFARNYFGEEENNE